jgi:hypothetical protein
MSAVRGQTGAAYAGLRQGAAADPTDPDYAEAALDLRIARHPLLLPVRPIVRFGPLRAWPAAMMLIFGLRQLGLPVASFAAAVAWLALCVYSWVVPPLVRGWMRRRWH